MFSFYKNEIIKNNSYIIGNILEKYPELENNIIDSILTNEGNIELGLKTLKKYGLDNIENLDYIDYNENIKKRVITYNFLFNIIIFLLLGIISKIVINTSKVMTF